MEIIAKDVCLEKDGKVILNKVSCKIQGGKLTAIVGPSGCGKTSLLNCLSLLQKITSGSVIIDGKVCTNWTEAQRTKFWHERAAFVYQDYGMIEDATVIYNITLKKTHNNLAEVKDVLEKVGLSGREKSLGISLSGGEKQRVAIARALFKKANVIYADEPTASLDPKNRNAVVALLQVAASSGAIVLVATHDEWLMNQCDEIVKLG